MYLSENPSGKNASEFSVSDVLFFGRIPGSQTRGETRRALGGLVSVAFSFAKTGPGKPQRVPWNFAAMLISSGYFYPDLACDAPSDTVSKFQSR